MEISQFDDYKDILKFSVQALKTQFGQRFTYEKLAQSCGIQKTYLSRVLNGSSHLGADQCYKACLFLNFSDAQTDFTMLTHEASTSVFDKRKKRALQKIEKLRAQSLATNGVLESDTNFEETLSIEYFGNANMQLIYLALTIPYYQNNYQKIPSELCLSSEEFQETLIRLQDLKLVVFKSGSYEARPFKRHLSATSPYISHYHLTHRLKASAKLMRPKLDKNYMFSAVFSADEKTRYIIHQQILDLISNAQKSISKAEDTSVFQLNIDLLTWLQSEDPKGK